MPVDTSFYNIKAPEPVNPLKTIADITGIQNAQLQNQRGQVALTAEKAALATKQYMGLNKIMGDLSSKAFSPEGITQKEMINAGVNAVADGIINREQLNNFMMNMGEDTPQNNANLIGNMAFKLQEAAKQHEIIYGKPIENDVGGTKQYGVQLDPQFGGAAEIANTIDKTITPSEGASQVDTYDPSLKANVKVPLSSLVTPTGQPKNRENSISDEDAKLEDDLKAAVRPKVGVQASPSLGEETAATGATDALNNLYESVSGSGARVYQLKEAQNALDKTTTGPGTAGRVKASEAIGAFLPKGAAEKLSALGLDPHSDKYYDEATKLLTAYAARKGSGFGTNTNDKLAAAFSSNANTGISQLAAKDIVKMTIGLERMEQAQADAWNRYDPDGIKTNEFNRWQTKWNKDVIPQVFVMDELNPKQRAAAISRLKGDDRVKFAAQLRDAIKNGYVKNPSE